eukprot:5619860-Amphidinium_carterae.2
MPPHQGRRQRLGQQVRLVIAGPNTLIDHPNCLTLSLALVIARGGCWPQTRPRPPERPRTCRCRFL